MAEQSGDDKYIKCSHCKCKYINNDEHIKSDFGFNRLNERYKTCVKCRTKTNNLFDILPDHVIDTIHKYKHQLEFEHVMAELNNFFLEVDVMVKNSLEKKALEREHHFAEVFIISKCLSSGMSSSDAKSMFGFYMSEQAQLNPPSLNQFISIFDEYVNSL